MHSEILRNLLLLAVLHTIVRVSQPAPRPWPVRSRMPSGHEHVISGANPALRTHRSRDTRAPVIALEARLVAGPAGRGRRTHRGRRSRRRGRRGGVRWIGPGGCRPGHFMIGQLKVNQAEVN